MEHSYTIPKKKKGEKLYIKSARVKAQKHTQKKLDILMVLTNSRLVKLNMIMINLNEYLRNVG